jgi:hypothetical protein
VDVTGFRIRSANHVDETGDGFRATNYGMELPMELDLQIMGMVLVL